MTVAFENKRTNLAIRKGRQMHERSVRPEEKLG